MAINTRDISVADSIAEQKQDYVLEAGTHYADSSRQAVERFQRYVKDGHVVDLGCGDGAATEFFNKDITLLGVDVNPYKLEKNPANSVCKDMVGFLSALDDDSIPALFSHHALEHLPNPQDVLNLIADKMEPGGTVYLEVPANDHIHSVHHATFDSPEDLLPKGFEMLESGSDGQEHYILARKP